MYLEIKDLTSDELELLKKDFNNRVRPIHSIYHEICRVEADCSIERVIDENEISLSEEKYEQATEDIAQKLANECENTAFQEMCERADDITRRHFS